MTGRNGEAAFDWWTTVHFASGVGLGLWPLGWLSGVGLIVGYEGLEGLLRRVKTADGGLFEYESWPNVVVDILIGVAGFAITHVAVRPFMPWPWSLP